MKAKTLYRWLVLVGIAVIGCQNEISAPVPVPKPDPVNSTWDLIQQKIFDANCVSCHSAGTSFARQSGLVLTKDAAYRQLINVPPQNQAAAADGLVRVGTKGMESVEKSFLWEKVNAPNQDHLYADHPHYGAIMPLGGPPLTYGELELIRRWIVAGAPDTGKVVDPAVLDDKRRYEPKGFEALPQPAKGIQLRLGPFEVAANYEREFLYYSPLNYSEDVFIKRVEVAMRPGSHHFLLYTYQDNIPASLIPPAGVYRDFRDQAGNYIPQNLTVMEYVLPIAGTQYPLLNYHFPPGVALRLKAGRGLDLNSHYANRTAQPVQGEVYVNLHFADRAEIAHVAENLFLSNDEFELPPNRRTTISRTFTTDQRLHIFQLMSHAHEHMTQFNVEIAGGPRNGELIYVAYDWQHLPILALDPPLVLEPGQGLRLITTYNNWTNRTLQFGLLSEDEMQILFGYYYTD